MGTERIGTVSGRFTIARDDAGALVIYGLDRNGRLMIRRYTDHSRREAVALFKAAEDPELP